MADFGIGETAAAVSAASAAEASAATAAAMVAEGAAAAEAAAAGAATASALTAAGTSAGLSASTWLTLASSATSILGTASSTQRGIANARNQSQMAKLGQNAALMEASSKEDAAAYSATQFARRASLLEGKQVATTAASGLVTTSGTPLFNEIDAHRQAKLEEENILRTGDVAAASSNFEAGLSGYRSSFFRGQIGSLEAGGALQAGGTILSDFLRKR